MTKKRIRYSELSTPQPPAPQDERAPDEGVAPAAPVDAPPVIQNDAASVSSATEIVANEPEHVGGIEFERYDEPLLLSAAPAASLLEEAPAPVEPARAQAARPRRNSTPVELARTLTAERAAARAQEGDAGVAEAPDKVVAIEAADEPQRTLRERARSKSGTAELLMFFVGGERFAVELILVDEVLDLPVIHHVPEMPPAMLGVVTVRGALTPVYSPQHALGRALAVRDALLIFRRGSHRVGILIDDVDDALLVDMGELREKPAGEEGDNVLLGVIRLANTLVGIIDADALITSCQSAHILEPA